jgi:general secretion pathway protein G
MITKERIDVLTVRGRGKGFTLIEILIVIAIIAILASVILVGLGPTQKEGRDSRRISDLSEVQNALELFYNNCGFYPGSSLDVSGGCPSNWALLAAGTGSYSTMATEVTGLTNIDIPQIPNDPTSGDSYTYESVTANSYTLAATLEDTANAAMTSDEKTDPNGGTISGCGTTVYCVSL